MVIGVTVLAQVHALPATGIQCKSSLTDLYTMIHKRFFEWWYSRSEISNVTLILQSNKPWV